MRSRSASSQESRLHDDAVALRFKRSEENEDLLDVTLDVLDFLAENVEADGLGDGTALADGHDVTSSETESGGAVHGHVLMTLLESVVLLDVVEVIAADDDCAGHFGGDHNTPKEQVRIRVSTRII